MSQFWMERPNLHRLVIAEQFTILQEKLNMLYHASHHRQYALHCMCWIPGKFFWDSTLSLREDLAANALERS